MIGDTIRTARKSASLSADELADRIGTTGTTVLRWERGEVSPPLAQLEAIAEALGLRLVVEFSERGDAQLREHYTELFGNTAGVGATLLGRALYRIRHGDGPEDRDALRAEVLRLREKYGETVNREDALREVDHA